MVDRNPWLNFFSHAVLIFGVAIVAFPLYLALVASTHTASEIVQAPMPLLPGTHMWENYKEALIGAGKQGSNTTVVNLTAQITALATALRIVLDASPNAAQAREQLNAALDKTIHDALEEGVWDNADGVKTIKAALLG